MHEFTSIDRVGVIGCGTMGSGIAESCVRAGLEVRVVVTSDRSATTGRKRIASSLERAVSRGRLSESARDAALDALTVTTELSDLADRELVIEAVAESEATKAAVLEQVGEIIKDPDAILASTTSSYAISRLGRACGQPQRFLGLHFFNPVPAMPLVEVVPAILTDPWIRDRAEAFVTRTLGKEAVRAPDRCGFVVNALLVPYLLSAVRMVEAGIAEPQDIDRAMVGGCAHPQGPLKLIDLIGLDIVDSVARALYEEFREPLYASPPLLRRMVESGMHGRKTGRGFYDYQTA